MISLAMKVDVHATINFVYIHTTHNVDTIQIREITICKSCLPSFSASSEMIKCGGGGPTGCFGDFFGIFLGIGGMVIGALFGIGGITLGTTGPGGMMTFGCAFTRPGRTSNFTPVPTT